MRGRVRPRPRGPGSRALCSPDIIEEDPSRHDR
jgi:hypothetical protein